MCIIAKCHGNINRPTLVLLTTMAKGKLDIIDCPPPPPIGAIYRGTWEPHSQKIFQLAEIPQKKIYTSKIFYAQK